MDNRYVAYSDESSYTDGRYRSIAVVSLRFTSEIEFNTQLLELLKESGIQEFKWNRSGSAREKFAAQKLINFALDKIINKSMRIDVLVWDMQDYRHSNVKKRDDLENLRRMYFHLLKNVLNNRWGSNTRWFIKPDEQLAIDWDKVRKILNYASNKSEMISLYSEGYHVETIKNFNILGITQVISEKYPLVQLADLFAGLAVYSYTSFEKYTQYLEDKSGQQFLFPISNKPTLSKKDKPRCEVLQHLDDHCQKYSLEISLQSTKGLKTHNPKKTSLNFWLYESKSSLDQAPSNVGK